ncbi:TIGR02186 family protein [Oceanidesulfovibrio marinus]|uniref:TIGR02186 family protein n=1 Tax=Oceanidesulfovibrio marinus TaxID=370038 RepID=UPI00399F85A4
MLRIVGEDGELHMTRKDKALGLLWMNMDSLTFHGVPVLYIVGPSKPRDHA